MPDPPRRPPRPEERLPRPPSMPEDLQTLFLQEWWDERRDGVSTRSMHEMLKGHIDKDEEHQQEILQRVASLEADGKRDAEERTGRIFLNGKKSTKPPGKAWWEREPFVGPLKYALMGLFGILGAALLELLHRLGLPAAHP